MTMQKLKRRNLKPDDCYVIIAAHNEEKHIAGVVKRVLKQGFHHVVVANDGSTDRTAQQGEKAGAIVVSHVTNLGKGAVMKTGADYAKTQGTKALIFIDGDGQHKPEELPLFLAALNNGYDIAFGCRRRTRDMPFVRKLGGWGLATVVRLIYDLDLKDILSGYRGMTIEAYDKVRWNARDYSVETEMIARAGKATLRYTQFEIATIYLDNWKGMSVIDGIPIAFKLLWWRMTH